jgi:hypothetical protein
MKPAELKTKKVKGLIKVLKATLYKDHMIYVRMFGKDYFEYLVVFNGEVYSSYIIITPKEGKDKLSKSEILQCMAIIYAGGESTVDALLGIDVDPATKELVEKVEKAGKAIDDAASV